MTTPAHPVAPPTAAPARRLTPGTAVVGLQWGDEGKGKIVHLLTETHDAVVRFNGGANAGHSVVVKGERFALHLVPSGILHPGKPAIIGSGVVIDPAWLLKEMQTLRDRGVDLSALRISDRAHVVMPWHKDEDELRERWLAGGSGEPIGTTKRGIGPCYADKVQRGTAIRMGDLVRPDLLRERIHLIASMKAAILSAMSAGAPPRSYDPADILRTAAAWGQALGPAITDTSSIVLDHLEGGRRVLFEGANATLLDVDHGTYPFVTSSSTCAVGIASGAGVPPSAVGTVLGVMKAYSTRVGGGPMPTELVGSPATEALAHQIREKGREYGTTTGRPRRVGWLDLVAVKYSARLNGAAGLALMLLDVLGGLSELRVCTAYRTAAGESTLFPPDAAALGEVTPLYQTLQGWGDDLTGARRLSDLPSAARAYIDLIERYVGVPARFVSVGPGREQTIECF